MFLTGLIIDDVLYKQYIPSHEITAKACNINNTNGTEQGQQKIHTPAKKDGTEASGRQWTPTNL